MTSYFNGLFFVGKRCLARFDALCFTDPSTHRSHLFFRYPMNKCPLPQHNAPLPRGDVDVPDPFDSPDTGPSTRHDVALFDAPANPPLSTRAQVNPGFVPDPLVAVDVPDAT